MDKKTFFSIAIMVVVLALLFGIVFPTLMSAKSTIAVGIVLTIATISIFGLIYYAVFGRKKEKK